MPGGFNCSDLLASAKARAPAADRRIPGSSLADRSFWVNLAKNALFAGLEPGILRSDTGVQTSALASHERNLVCISKHNLWARGGHD